MGKERVQELMQLHGIRAKGKCRFKLTTDSNHDLPIAFNRLDRQFNVATPDTVWAGDIVIDALRMAWFKRHPSKQAGPIFHSDRGSQYASQDFRDVLTEYGITASMSRRGSCWDNACSETLFGSLKVEREDGAGLHGQRFVTRRQAKDESIAWMLCYNQTRLHSTLAYVSPLRFEQDWLAAQAKQANS